MSVAGINLKRIVLLLRRRTTANVEFRDAPFKIVTEIEPIIRQKFHPWLIEHYLSPKCPMMKPLLQRQIVDPHLYQTKSIISAPAFVARSVLTYYLLAFLIGLHLMSGDTLVAFPFMLAASASFLQPSELFT